METHTERGVWIVGVLDMLTSLLWVCEPGIAVTWRVWAPTVWVVGGQNARHGAGGMFPNG